MAGRQTRPELSAGYLMLQCYEIVMRDQCWVVEIAGLKRPL